MARIKKDELEHCIRNKRCVDCHEQNEVIEASEFQRRRRLIVPCCRKHFNEYRSKMSRPNHRKHQRRSQTKLKMGICSYPGCHHKLIPQELIPRQLRDRSCGLHGRVRAFRLNRSSMSEFIIKHCLTAEQREGMKLRNIVYKPDEPLAFVGLQYPKSYQTLILPAIDLRRRYDENLLQVKNKIGYGQYS